jgi:hypothetical protein
VQRRCPRALIVLGVPVRRLKTTKLRRNHDAVGNRRRIGR